MKPSRVQFTLGRLMIGVAAVGFALVLLLRVEGFFAFALIGLAALLLMMGAACAVACMGVAFARMSTPTVHPLSDHAVDHFDREPPDDRGIAFEPDDHA